MSQSQKHSINDSVQGEIIKFSNSQGTKIPENVLNMMRAPSKDPFMNQSLTDSFENKIEHALKNSI